MIKLESLIFQFFRRKWNWKRRRWLHHKTFANQHHFGNTMDAFCISIHFCLFFLPQIFILLIQDLCGLTDETLHAMCDSLAINSTLKEICLCLVHFFFFLFAFNNNNSSKRRSEPHYWSKHNEKGMCSSFENQYYIEKHCWIVSRN